MPTDPNDPYYKEGKRAYAEGMRLCDAPHELTRNWEIGWLDALAEAVRSPPAKGSSPR